MNRVQSNDPADLHHYYWNQRQVAQQAYLSKLSGGSWSQPYWNGWIPMTNSLPKSPVANFENMNYGKDFFQRYAQDGDSGFFQRGFSHGTAFGGAMPLNTFDEQTNVVDYDTPVDSTILPEEPLEIPSAQPDATQLEEEVVFNAEPQQRATHVPPYSKLLVQGLGKEEDALYEEPFEIPKYKGFLHKKEKRFK